MVLAAAAVVAVGLVAAFGAVVVAVAVFGGTVAAVVFAVVAAVVLGKVDEDAATGLTPVVALERVVAGWAVVAVGFLTVAAGVLAGYWVRFDELILVFLIAWSTDAGLLVGLLISRSFYFI